jgi:uncharacterized protein (DUF1330 family)
VVVAAWLSMVGELLAERGEDVLVSRYPPEHNAAPSNTIREEVMKTYYTVAASMLAGFGLGSLAIQALHAQGKPPVYVVTEIDVTNVDAYNKEYVPVVRPIIAQSGGKLIAVSQNPASLEGAPQKSRVAINMFESLEKAKAWREAADYKEARKIGDKYAKFRAYVVDGLPQ